MPERKQFVLVPRVSANDDYVTLIAWFKADGEAVAAGDKVCEVESSKSAVGLEAPCDGYLFRLRREGEEVAVSKPVGLVSLSPERPDTREADPGGRGQPPAEVRVTAKARALIAAHDVPPGAFPGLDVVKEKHVQDYLASRKAGAEAGPVAEGDLVPISAARRRAARTVTESARTIPHSYLHRWVDAASVAAHLDRVGRRLGLTATASDLLVASVANAAARHPGVNASWRDDGVFRYRGVHVGFALNQADGDLIVPVVKDADRLPFDDLVGRIRGLHKKALRRKLTPEDLTGGTVTVTSLVGTGVHQVLPILVPGQSAIVAVGDPCSLPGLQVYTLTVAFDHRVLNGAEAAGFLATVSEGLLEGRADG